MTHLSPRAIEAIKACLASKDVTGYVNGPEIIYRAVLTALEAEGMVVVPKSSLDWLFGEAPDADGKWFGECEEATKLIAGRFKRTYWWRSKFRSMLQAAQGGDDAGQ